MKPLATTLFLLAALFANGASANADLAKKSNCFACHTTDKKLVGPAYRDVARRYAGDKTAEARLIEKVKKGGSGAWKDQGIVVPMPPNSTVKDEDIKALVRWILAGAQ
jgi:cytochrome c